MDTSAFPAFQALCSFAHGVFSGFHTTGEHAWMRDAGALEAPYMALRLHAGEAPVFVPMRRAKAQNAHLAVPLTGGHTALSARHAIGAFLDAASRVAPTVRHPAMLQPQLVLRFSPSTLAVDPDRLQEGAYTLLLPGVVATTTPQKMAEEGDDLSWRLAVLSQVQSVGTTRRYKVCTEPNGPYGHAIVGADTPFDACLRAMGTKNRAFAQQVLAGKVSVFEEHPAPLDGLDALHTHLADQQALPT